MRILNIAFMISLIVCHMFFNTNTNIKYHHKFTNSATSKVLHTW